MFQAHALRHLSHVNGVQWKKDLLQLVGVAVISDIYIFLLNALYVYPDNKFVRLNQTFLSTLIYFVRTLHRATKASSVIPRQAPVARCSFSWHCDTRRLASTRLKSIWGIRCSLPNLSQFGF